MNSDTTSKYHDKLSTELDLNYQDATFKVILKQSDQNCEHYLWYKKHSKNLEAKCSVFSRLSITITL